jgi:hypothetical protein
MAWHWADQATPPGKTIGPAIGTLTVKDNPAAQTRPYAFVRTTDGHLWVNWWDGAAWHWADQGTPPGKTIDPTAIGTLTVRDNPNAQTRPYAFVRTTDGHLWVNWWDGAAWHWADQGTPPGKTVPAGPIGTLTVQDNPTAQTRPHTFVRASDGHLWVNWWDGAAWHWADQGTPPGKTIGPAIGALTVRDNPNAQTRPHVFVRTTDGHLWVNWWDGAGWQWADQGTPPGKTIPAGDIGTLTVRNNPTAQTRPYAFVRASDGHLWVNWWDGAAWHWADQGTPPGKTVDSAAIGTLTVRDNPNAQTRPYAFVRTTDGHLWVNWWDGAAWHWADQGTPSGKTVQTGDIGTLTVQDNNNAPTRPYVFVRASDGHLWVNWWSSPAPTFFVRRDIWELEKSGPFDPITLAYAKAVKVMQQRPATDPTSWSFQAAIHGSYNNPPPGAAWNQCQHQGWFFFPWHRMYLYYFERIVRKAVLAAGGPADFALPYWNYSKPFPANTLPTGFRTATLPDSTANPLSLASPRRLQAIMNGGQLSPTDTNISIAMGRTAFSTPTPGFGGGKVGPQHFGNFSDSGALELTPHNTIHVALCASPSGQCQGALMIDPNCSALDPIFWLHHANVDRLWNDWLALGGTRVNPPDNAWRNASFAFYDENGTKVTMTVAQVLDSANQLRYIYDDVPSFEMASPPPEDAPQAGGPPELVAATDEPLTLAGGSASVTLSAPGETHELLSNAAAPGPGRVLVTIDDIKADINPGVVYAVFLNAPDDDGDPLKYHIGNIALFGIEKMNDPDERHEGAPGFQHVFDATEVAGQLAEEGRWDPSAVTVTFEPSKVLPPPGEEDTWDSGQTEEEATVPPIEIGRVSLLVA